MKLLMILFYNYDLCILLIDSIIDIIYFMLLIKNISFL